ncbi:MAG: hypothetical protein V4541_14025 [Bacteroidota bacterium]
MPPSTMLILSYIGISLLLTYKGDQKEELKLTTFSSYNDSTVPTVITIDHTKESFYSVISRAESLISLQNSNIEIATTAEYGAFSVIDKTNYRRFILYSPEFFNAVSKNCENDLGVLSISLHELGHLLYNHPLRRSKIAQIFEKEADRFSGYYMCLAGATLEQSLSAIQKFGNETETETHPSKAVRMKEIEAGYIDAKINVFKDTTYKQERIIFQEKEKKFAIISIEKYAIQKNKTGVGKGIINRLPASGMPTLYLLLGEIIFVDSKNAIKTYWENKTIGKLSSINYSGDSLITIEDVKYKLINGQIYSAAPKAPKIVLGQEIKP